MGGGVKAHGAQKAPSLPPPQPWRAYDLRALGALIPAVARPALRRRGGQAALVMADWAEIAGQALAALGVPKSLSAGTLTLAASGPAAMQLQMMAPQVIERVNTHLGRAVVQRLRFVQAAPPRPGPSPRPATPPRPDTPLPPRLQADLSGIADPLLRAALEKMARGVYRNLSRG